MPSDPQHIEPAERHRGKGCAILMAACAIVLMACALGGVLIQWRGGELPQLSGQVGPYRVIGYTTVAPSCSPAVLCTQQFADVPLPHYYVVWVIPRRATNGMGTRVLTIPLTLPLAR